MGIRVEKEEEAKGLDLSEHGDHYTIFKKSKYKLQLKKILKK